MIDQQNWISFRHQLRDLRLTGKSVKYIGKTSKTPLFITGIPVAGNKIFVGDIVLDQRSFLNLTHLQNSFSVDGTIITIA